MNKLKLKLVKYAPFLVKKELDSLARTNGEGLINGRASKLELLLAEVCNDQLLTYIEKNFKITFIVSKYTPDALKHNRDYLNHVMKSNPYWLIYFPNEMITLEDIKLYEQYLLNHKYGSVVLPVPDIFLSSKIIVDYWLEHTINSTFVYHGSNFIECLNFFVKAPGYLDMFLERCPTSCLNYLNLYNLNKIDKNVFYNDRFIDSLLLINPYEFFDIIPEEKKDYAFMKMQEKSYKAELPLKLNNLGNTDNLFSKKEILILYLKNLLAHGMIERKSSIIKDENLYLSTMNDYYKIEYSYFSVYKNILFDIFKYVDFDKFNFNKDEKYFIINIMINLFDERHRYCIRDFLSKKEWALALVESGNINYLFDFNREALDDEIKLKVVLKLYENFANSGYLNHTYLTNLFDFFPNDQDIIEFIFSSIKTDPKKLEYIYQYYNHFKITEYSDKVIPIIVDVILMNSNPNYDFINFFSNNEKVLSELARRKVDKLIFSKFNDLAFKDIQVDDLFKNYEFDDFDFITRNRNINIKFNFYSVDELNIYLNKAISQNNYKYILMLLSYYKINNFKLESIDEKFDYLVGSIKNNLLANVNSSFKNLLIDKILQGVVHYSVVDYIDSDKTCYFSTNIVEIRSTYSMEYVNTLPNDILLKLNKKHCSDIYKLLKLKNVSNCLIVKLMINIYLSLGYARARDLLSSNIDKSYGQVGENTLNTIFGNISPNAIEMKQEGNSYVPVLNNAWINLIFGSNYKVKNTPIRNLLLKCMDKREEIEQRKKIIKSDLTLTEEVKIEKINLLEKQFSTYEAELNKFFENIGVAFNQWDIIEEEFLKAQSKSKLKMTLNLSKINEIIDIIKSKSKLPELDYMDQPLLDTDVFSYVGYDTQYTVNPQTAPARAVELSRGMSAITTKKFPRVSLKQDGLCLEVYNPQDRGILSAGYKSGCCFRPNGNADNGGQNNSLLYYCTNTTYGGGIRIEDEEGNLLMFSPLLRNGNVLMIHSIETKGLNNKSDLVHELLVKFAEEVIRISKDTSDPIDFVTITDLHYLDKSYVKGNLPNTKKFSVYDENNSFTRMYNNLNYTHMILASREGVTFDDIVYGSVQHDYTFPIKTFYDTFSFANEEDIILLQQIDMLKTRINLLSNKRNQLLQDGKSDEAYELLVNIKNTKKEYLVLFKKMLSLQPGKNLYESYKKAMQAVELVSNKLNREIPSNILEITYGNGWYIAITSDGKLIGYCLSGCYDDFKKYYENLKQFNPDLESYYYSNTDVIDDNKRKL